MDAKPPFQTPAEIDRQAAGLPEKGRAESWDALYPRLPEVEGLLAHIHFKRTTSGSPWSVARGYHTLRHSFISASASRGVDQRLIREWVGHLTAQAHESYMSLYPSVQNNAIGSVFD